MARKHLYTIKTSNGSVLGRWLTNKRETLRIANEWRARGTFCWVLNDEGKEVA